jgi:hypothetical protein
MISFTDAASRFSIIHFMRNKNKVFLWYKKVEQWLKTQKEKPIKRIHFDNGTELIHGEFRSHCKNNGTIITTTAPYSSSQNRYAERLNWTLAEKTRLQIQGNSNTVSKPFYWQELTAYACLIKSFTATMIRDKYITPHELMFGKKPNVAHLQQWGTTCHVLIQSDKNKIGSRTKDAIFTGISNLQHGTWHYLALPNRSIQESCNVFFPKNPPDPATSDKIALIGLSKEHVIDELDEWVKVTPPSEGEMEQVSAGSGGVQAADPSTVSTPQWDTSHKDLPVSPWTPEPAQDNSTQPKPMRISSNASQEPAKPLWQSTANAASIRSTTGPAERTCSRTSSSGTAAPLSNASTACRAEEERPAC